MSSEGVNRDHLKTVFTKLTMISCHSPKLFKWTGRMEDHVLRDVESLYFSKLGLVKWPLDCNEIRKVVDNFRPVTFPDKARDCCQVEASQVTLIPREGGTTTQQLLQSLTSCAVQKMFEVSLDRLSFSIEAKLEKLVICSEGESHNSPFSLSDQPGKFGTVFLQVPISGDQSCGTLVLCDGTEETRIPSGSNPCYSAAAVAGQLSIDRKGSLHIRCGAKELTAVMIFSLEWNDHLTFGYSGVVPSSYFPELLVYTHEIKKTLTLWDEDGTEHSNDDEEPNGLRHLCFPLILRPGAIPEEELTLANLPTHQEIAVRCLMSITFIDGLLVLSHKLTDKMQPTLLQT